jgi:DNA-3-methyladenine glycosylase
VTEITAKRLGREFYSRPTETVARELLGCQFVRASPDGEIRGWIVETEAYLPHGDPACHANRGSTPSNRSMFLIPGTCYVYPIHAKYCVNVSTEADGIGAAVLIRGIEVTSGNDLVQRRRGTISQMDWCRGPARLCLALSIDRSLDGEDTIHSERIWIEQSTNQPRLPAFRIGTSPRIGVTSAESLELRFFVDGNRFVSGRRRDHSRRAADSFAESCE